MEINIKNLKIPLIYLAYKVEDIITRGNILTFSNHILVTVLNQQIVIINTETKTETTIPYYSVEISPEIKVVFNDKQGYDKFLKAIQ